jgi:hypothetical protein
MTNRFGITLALLVAFSGAYLAEGARDARLKNIYGSRWVPLPLPDSRVAPGAIVSIRNGQVAWESTLTECGAPPAVMQVTSGAAGTIDTKTEAEYGADAALQIAGVSAGPEFKKVKKATLKLEGHSAEGIDRIRLGTWINQTGMRLPPVCEKFLKQRDIFIVQEAFKVTKAALTLYDDKDAKISLGGINLGIVKIGANAKAKVTANGSIDFEAPVYTAIRRLKYMKDGELKTLSTPGPETTRDAEARLLLYPPTK